MRFDIVSIFPEVFEPVFRQGVVGRAIGRGLLELRAHDLRDFTTDRHRQVDDAPFGGGAGMVLKPEPIFAAVEALRARNPGPVVLMEPWGEPLTQALAAELAAQPGLIVVCGRYEGVDDRVRQALADREVSIGDYVLTGGELPAMVLVDAVARLVPGVLGDEASLTQDAFAREAGGYPQFTRPALWRGLQVPDVLLSGNHAEIARWRRAHARTTQR
ncbi:MAG TPA: tRNA (guanosine(37)-N1)-methyltransferase TrmD, partial [Candidatus Eisenbacteria bacterium]|nr:tRNA (guanosine(37)-N1)-methyltransferase TrmD [Candidatus Eisenbacteria bacterium]